MASLQKDAAVYDLNIFNAPSGQKIPKEEVREPEKGAEQEGRFIVMEMIIIFSGLLPF